MAVVVVIEGHLYLILNIILVTLIAGEVVLMAAIAVVDCNSLV